jgi:hypothetical protein
MVETGRRGPMRGSFARFNTSAPDHGGQHQVGRDLGDAIFQAAAAGGGYSR